MEPPPQTNRHHNVGRTATCSSSSEGNDHDVRELVEEHPQRAPPPPLREHVGTVRCKATLSLHSAEAPHRGLQGPLDRVNRHGMPVHDETYLFQRWREAVGP